MSITVSESAADRVKNYLSKRGRGLGLRLAVKTTGCSGYAYVLDYVDELGDDDVVFEDNGITVVVDRESLQFVDGTRVDFVNEGLNQMFKFHNPKVAGECGCGESFTI